MKARGRRGGEGGGGRKAEREKKNEEERAKVEIVERRRKKMRVREGTVRGRRKIGRRVTCAGGNRVRRVVLRVKSGLNGARRGPVIFEPAIACSRASPPS